MSALRVVVIDDSPELLSVLADALHEIGPFDVWKYTADGVTADDLLGVEPNVVVLDLRLHGRDDAGWKLLTAIRAARSGIPVVICTADTDQLRKRSRALKRMDQVRVLEKPFGLEQLEAVLRDVAPLSAAPESEPIERPAQT